MYCESFSRYFYYCESPWHDTLKIIYLRIFETTLFDKYFLGRHLMEAMDSVINPLLAKKGALYFAMFRWNALIGPESNVVHFWM